MITDVKIKNLEVNVDQRGCLFEILRCDDTVFYNFKYGSSDLNFGQAYITVCNPGYFKGWHYHKKQNDRFCVIRGKANIVLLDDREESDTRCHVNSFEISSDLPKLLLIPKGVIHGFESATEQECWILNLSDSAYNPIEPDEFRYKIDDEYVTQHLKEGTIKSKIGG